MSGSCILICAGELKNHRIEKNDGDMIIAVDAGLAYCTKLGIVPDIILGDFDSSDEEQLHDIIQLREQSPQRVITLKPEKDDTDTLAALKVGLDAGFRFFHIYAGTGKRLDHTLANIQCLLFLKDHDANGILHDGESPVFVIKNEEVHFPASCKGTLSLFCLGARAKDVNIRGMKYNLEHHTMTNDFPLGISNEFTETDSFVSVGRGNLLCILQPDD